MDTITSANDSVVESTNLLSSENPTVDSPEPLVEPSLPRVESERGSILSQESLPRTLRESLSITFSLTNLSLPPENSRFSGRYKEEESAPSKDAFKEALSEEYTAIVLSGGGTKGIAHLGVLYQAFSSRVIKYEKLNVLAGSSIGYIICVMLCLDFDPIELFDIVYCMDRLFDVSDCNRFKDIMSSLSLISIETLREKILYIMQKKTSRVPTLKELYEISGKIVIGTRVNEKLGVVEYFSHVVDPDLSCIDAMLMSCALPWVFEAYVFQGTTYVDGGLLDNFPALYVSQRYPNYRIFAILIDNTYHQEEIPRFLAKSRLSLIVLPINELTQLRCSLLDYSRVSLLKVELPPTNAVEFFMSSEKKMKLFMCGMRDMALYTSGASYRR